jgi:hypothetical protein
VGVRPVVVLDVFALATGTDDANRRPSLSMIGEPDIPPTVLAPMIHSGPPKLCTRQACHRRSSSRGSRLISCSHSSPEGGATLCTLTC